jgi:outer membrane receptor protein involved in Fe transport
MNQVGKKIMKINKILTAMLLIQGGGLLLPCIASAQAVTGAAQNPAVEEKAKQERTDEELGLNVEEIIVTGVAGGAEVTKFEASFSITTMNQEQMKEIAPQSTADLLGEIPGIFTEGGTAGEASNNANVRGIPSSGGFKFLPLLVDGLPMYEEPEIGFMNNDVFIRADLMTQSVETVRGGPSAVLYSHALGGAANFITRTGGSEYEGAVKVEVGDWGHVRNDFFVSGPLTDRLTFAVGGFYRVSDGIRDPGYTGNDGGQLRGNLVWTSEDELTKVELHAHALRDKTIFYQNIPFTIPRVEEAPTLDNPARVEDIQDLGIDLATGTLASNDLRTGTIKTASGPQDYDLANGVNPTFDIWTLKFSRDFDTWKIENNMRKTSGTNGYNAIFAGTPVTAEQFISDRERNDVANRAYTAAQQCDMDSVYLSYYGVTEQNCGDNLNAANLTDFIDSYRSYGNFSLQYADDGTPLDVAASPYVAFQTLWLAEIEADMFVDDLRLHTSVDMWGEHNLTFGAYFSSYNLGTHQTVTEVITDVTGSPRKLDLIATSVSGAQIGPSLTDYGIYRHVNTHLQVDDKHEAFAFYVNDDWAINDRLDVNLGARWHQLNIDSNYFFADTGTDITPANVDVGSTSDTLADNSVVGLSGRVQAREAKFDQNGWTFGANYRVLDNVALFGRVSESFRMPRSEVIWADRTSADPIQTIDQLEGGVKYMGETIDAFVTVFWNQFQATGSNHQYTDIEDPACQVTEGNLIDLSECRTIEGISRRGTENLGVELEAHWRPDLVPGFELSTTITWQDPEFSGGNVPIVEAVTEENDEGVFETTGYRTIESGIDGNIPRRFARLMTNIRPSYDLESLTGVPVTVYGAAQYLGERFGEDDNLIIYPDYWYFEAGVTGQINDQFSTQLHVTNITNEAVLTEGGNVDVNAVTVEGDRNIALGRPLMGRTIKLSLTYEF